MRWLMAHLDTGICPQVEKVGTEDEIGGYAESAQAGAKDLGKFTRRGRCDHPGSQYGEKEIARCRMCRSRSQAKQSTSTNR